MKRNPNVPLFSAVAWTIAAAAFSIGTFFTPPGNHLFVIRLLTAALAFANAVIQWINYHKMKQEERKP